MPEREGLFLLVRHEPGLLSLQVRTLIEKKFMGEAQSRDGGRLSSMTVLEPLDTCCAPGFLSFLADSPTPFSFG